MKKQIKTIIGVISFLVILSILFFFILHPKSQSFLGNLGFQQSNLLSLGNNQLDFLGYTIKVNIIQGVQTRTFYVSGHQVCTTEILSYNDYHKTICNIIGGGNIPYIDPYYCSYSIEIYKGNSLIKNQSGDTLNNFIKSITMDDFTFSLSGSDFSGANIGWNTIHSCDFYDPETGSHYGCDVYGNGGKQMCSGFLSNILVKIPQDKLDLSIINNTVIFTNNWRDLKGELCILKNISGKLIGECDAQKDLKIGQSVYSFSLRTESANLIPVLKNAIINDFNIGDFRGDSYALTIKKPEPIQATAPETITKTETIQLTQTTNNPITVIPEETKKEIIYQNIFQKIWNWILSFI